jgi:chorismate mutase
MRAVRGATVSPENIEEKILEVTIELLNQIIANNKINPDDIISVIFTSTSDITACFPGKAVREMGLGTISVLDTRAPNINGDISLCIRVMMYVDTSQTLSHVYMGDTKKLRPER